jgi:hypothetical protein
VITAAFSAAAPSTGRSTEAGASGSTQSQRPPRVRSASSAAPMAAIRVVEGAGPAGARLDDDLQLGPVLVVVAQGRQRHLRLARLAVAQDDQPGRRDPLGQDLVTQGEGGKRLQPRVQRGEDEVSRVV